MTPVIGGAFEYQNAGTPVDGTNEVQTLTIGGTPTSGTFKLAYEGQITAAITWSATNATLIANIQAALRALATIGSSEVTVTDSTLSSGIGDVLITFGGNLAKLVVPTITVDTNNLAGSSPTVAVAETTPGVTATARGAAPGAELMDTTNQVLYVNDGTALEPSWNRVSDRQFVKSKVFNIDNGSGTTDDDVILKPSVAITILSTRVVYDEATDTAGAENATIQLGTAAGGEQLVAATALEASKAVGAQTALTLATGAGAVAAGGAIFARHTGIAATEAGQYHLEIEFTVDE